MSTSRTLKQYLHRIGWFNVQHIFQCGENITYTKPPNFFKKYENSDEILATNLSPQVYHHQEYGVMINSDLDHILLVATLSSHTSSTVFYLQLISKYLKCKLHQILYFSHNESFLLTQKIYTWIDTTSYVSTVLYMLRRYSTTSRNSRQDG